MSWLTMQATGLFDRWRRRVFSVHWACLLPAALVALSTGCAGTFHGVRAGGSFGNEVAVVAQQASSAGN